MTRPLPEPRTAGGGVAGVVWGVRNTGGNKREEGIIKAYLPVRGFGFIGREGAPDLFFHVIECVPCAKIRPGVPVEFSVTTDERGRPKAAHVELVGASKRNM